MLSFDERALKSSIYKGAAVNAALEMSSGQGNVMASPPQASLDSVWYEDQCAAEMGAWAGRMDIRGPTTLDANITTRVAVTYAYGTPYVVQPATMRFLIYQQVCA